MNDILKELSWPLKLKVLNELPGDKEKQSGKNIPPTASSFNYRDVTPLPPLASIVVPEGYTPSEGPVPTPPPEAPTVETTIFYGDKNELHTVLEDEPTFVYQPDQQIRRVGLARQVSLARRVGLARLTRRDATQDSDDNDMRLKLFRLMYETVRDSDLKVKRAELIKEHYVNSTTFEIGYLVGDITDKASIITDISMTLKRFYNEWKPIEHINAYEQIANQAIEITHLIDLVRIVNKKNKDSGGASLLF